MYYIYKIENVINHKKYIGLTNNIARRRARHFTDLRCQRHDNSFLQKEFNIFGEQNFHFEVVFEGQVTAQEISEKEKEYIKYYDSYYNGYNQNEGGNFGPSNGGSHLTKSDIFNILSALQFMSRPGAVLAQLYDVTTTTISRIKKGINHAQIKEEYESLPLEEQKAIYKIFCDSNDFITKKYNSTILQSKRKLTKEQVFMILCNFEYNIITQAELMRRFNILSDNTFGCIRRKETYKDYSLEYEKLTQSEKEYLVSLLSN